MTCVSVMMVSTGDGPIGIQKMTREILDVVEDLSEVMRCMP